MDAGVDATDPLPTEIWLLIFSFLSQSHLTGQIMPVCQLWRKLANDRAFWRTLILPLPSPATVDETHPLRCSSDVHVGVTQWLKPATYDAFRTVLIRCGPMVQNLIFHQAWSDRWCFDQRVSLPHLKSLSFCTFFQLRQRTLDNMVLSCPDLDTFNLKINRQDTRDTPFLSIANWPSLTRLHVETFDLYGRLSSTRHDALVPTVVGDAAAAAGDDTGDTPPNQADTLLATLAARCPRLERVHLSLDWSLLTDRGVTDAVYRYGLSDTLTHFTLRGGRVTDASLAALSTCAKLTHLTLKGCSRITADGLTALGALPELRALSLERPIYWSDGALETLFGHLHGLERLKIQRDLPVGVYRALGLANPRIHTLKLRSTSGVKALQIVGHFPRLRDLHLAMHAGSDIWTIDAILEHPSLSRLSILFYEPEPRHAVLHRIPDPPTPEWRKQLWHGATTDDTLIWFTKDHWPPPKPFSKPCSIDRDG